MSGTRPDRVVSPAGSASSPASGSASAGPHKGPKKHARALSYKNDEAHFGFEETFKRVLEANGSEAAELKQLWTFSAETNVTSPTEVYNRAENDRRRCINIASGIRGANEVYYEGKVIHPWYAQLLQQTQADADKALATISKWTATAIEGYEKELISTFVKLQGKDSPDKLSVKRPDGTTQDILKSTPVPKDLAPKVKNLLTQMGKAGGISPPSKKAVEESAPVPAEEPDQGPATGKLYTQAVSNSLKVSTKAPQEEKLTWADMVEEELAEMARETLASSSQSLFSVIRSRTGVAKENRVDIPFNLEKVLPSFYRRVQTAAILAGCELVTNARVKIELAYADAFLDDDVKRDDTLNALLNSDGTANKDLEAIADFAVLMENMLEIPSVDSLDVNAPGKLGLAHSACLLLRIYCEQHYSTPIAQQRNWWKGGPAIRDQMKSRIAGQVGGEAVATCLLNCYDILYRKFVRHVLQKGSRDNKALLHDIAEKLSSKLFVSGGALFTNLLRVETRTKKEKIPLPPVRGKERYTVEERKYVARVRPSITDGPKTSFESALFSKVNNALSKIDRFARPYSLSSQEFSSPKEWEEDHRRWVDSLYERVKSPSHLMVQRKKAIRAEILGKIATTGQAHTGQAPSQTPETKITSVAWMNAESEYINSRQDNLNDASVNAINEMLFKSFTKAELAAISEDDISIIFAKS